MDYPIWASRQLQEASWMSLVVFATAGAKCRCGPLSSPDPVGYDRARHRFGLLGVAGIQLVHLEPPQRTSNESEMKSPKIAECATRQRRKRPDVFLLAILKIGSGPSASLV